MSIIQISFANFVVFDTVQNIFKLFKIYRTAKALVYLCNSTDPETQRYALQTLELLAIESSEMICAQVHLYFL